MNPNCTIATVFPGPWRQSHQYRCLRCQASAVRTRALEREMRALRNDVLPAPPEIAGRVLARLGAQDSLVPRRMLVLQRIARQAAAATVAAATGVAVATGLIKRRKRFVVSH